MAWLGVSQQRLQGYESKSNKTVKQQWLRVWIQVWLSLWHHTIINQLCSLFRYSFSLLFATCASFSFDNFQHLFSLLFLFFFFSFLCYFSTLCNNFSLWNTSAPPHLSYTHSLHLFHYFTTLRQDNFYGFSDHGLVNRVKCIQQMLKAQIMGAML